MLLGIIYGVFSRHYERFIYVGKTKRTLSIRRNEHIRSSFRYKHRKDYWYAFHIHIREYGEDDLIWIILDKGNTDQELLELEMLHCYCLQTSHNMRVPSSDKHTEESKYKMSKAKKGKVNNRAKPIYCITLDKSFTSVYEAERILRDKGIKVSKQNIYSCCRFHKNGILKCAGTLSDGTKLQWRYL